MKKLIYILIVIVAVVGAYFWVRAQRVSLSGLEGKPTKVHRGDLIVPVTASGNIEPASITQIKGEASGTVVETPYDVGVMVKKGDLIIRLKELDEQRNVDRANADYARAVHTSERAKITLKDRKTSSLIMAGAKVAQAEARRIRAQSEYDHKLPLTRASKDRPPVVPKEEWDQVVSAKMEADALKDVADAEAKQALTAIEMAEWDLKSAEQNVETAKKTLEDAEERLRETKIFAPIDGMVLARYVRVGEVVLSGSKSLTGGTVLMELADVSQVFAVVNVDEADIGQVRQLAPPSARPGPTATQPASVPASLAEQSEPVEVKVESFPDERFQGIIERISPQSEVVRAIATFKVRIRITSSNRDKLIGLLNTQAEAHFTVNSVKNALLVSYDAVKPNPNGEGHGVFLVVRKPGARATEEFKLCKFGADNGIDVQVLEGLEEGDEVWIDRPQKTERERKEEEKRESES